MADKIKPLMLKLLIILTYVTGVFVIIIFSSWFWVQYKDSTNPTLTFAYISLIHLASIPLLYQYLSGHFKFLLPFVICIGSWIIISIVALILIYTETCE